MKNNNNYIYVPDFGDKAQIIKSCNDIPKLQYEFTDLFLFDGINLYMSIYSDINNNLYAVID